jgi:hypothetical protein
MKNNEDILKKILLHMKYDSRKTLKENKLLLEENKQYALASDGRTLELPLNTIINSYHNNSKFNAKSISDLEIGYPLWSESCKSHKPKEYDKCMNDYKTKWINSVKDGSVRVFTIDGKKYKQCYIVHVPDKNNSAVLGTPEDMKIVGYSDSCENNSRWSGYSKESPKKPDTIINNNHGGNNPTIKNSDEMILVGDDNKNINYELQIYLSGGGD